MAASLNNPQVVPARPLPLVLLGASVRPWLTAALLAGFHVHAFDLFADWDACELVRQAGKETTADSLNSNLPSSSLHVAESFIALIDLPAFRSLADLSANHRCEVGGVGRRLPIVVCGGVENHVEVLRYLERHFQVLGTAASDLQRLVVGANDHGGMSSVLPGVPGWCGQLAQVPETKAALTRNDDPQAWLSKRLGGAGGWHVRVAADVQSSACAASLPLLQEIVTPPLPRRYVQRRVVGESYSAVYCRGQLVSITRQLVGSECFGAQEFAYCGSIGPCEMHRFSQSALAQLKQIGRQLVGVFGIRGMWGADFLVGQQRDQIWITDVNPRLTASMELLRFLDFQSGTATQESQGRRSISSLELHLAACERAPNENSQDPLLDHRYHDRFLDGKAILFNRLPRPINFTEALFAAVESRFDREFLIKDRPGQTVCDIPRVGVEIGVGHPVLTIRLRSHRDVEIWQMEVALQQMAEEIYGELLQNS